VEEEQEQCKI